MCCGCWCKLSWTKQIVFKNNNHHHQTKPLLPCWWFVCLALTIWATTWFKDVWSELRLLSFKGGRGLSFWEVFWREIVLPMLGSGCNEGWTSRWLVLKKCEEPTRGCLSNAPVRILSELVSSCLTFHWFIFLHLFPFLKYLATRLHKNHDVWGCVDTCCEECVLMDDAVTQDDFQHF